MPIKHKRSAPWLAAIAFGLSLIQPALAGPTRYVNVAGETIAVPEDLNSNIPYYWEPDSRQPPGAVNTLLTIYFNTDPLVPWEKIGWSLFSIGEIPNALNQDFLCRYREPVRPPAGVGFELTNPESAHFTHVVYGVEHTFFGEPILVYLDDYKHSPSPNTTGEVYQTYALQRALTPNLVLLVDSRTDVIPLADFPQTLAKIESAVKAWMPDTQFLTGMNSKSCKTSEGYEN